MALQITSIRVMNEYEFEFGAQVEWQTGGESKNVDQKTCPIATSFIATPSRTGVKSNPNLCGFYV
jgi:hypothetical protein